MLKTCLAVSTLMLVGFFAFAQEHQAPPAQATAPASYTIPPEAVHQANPVPATPESLAAGKKWYGYDCAMCHGANGDAKGDIAADMKQKVTDFTNPATLKARTDGELFYVIKNGKGEMPAEGPRLKSNELWSLVNYVRSLAKKKTPAEEKASEEKPASENKPQP